MANRLELPSDPKLAAKIIDGEHGHRSRLTEMGIFGRLIGGGVEKPGNVAAFVIVVSLIGLIVVVFYSGIAEKTPLYGLFGGLITTSLGYIFGRSGH